MSSKLRPTASMTNKEISEAFDAICANKLDADINGCLYSSFFLLKAIEELHVCPLWDGGQDMWYADCVDSEGDNHRGTSGGLHMAIAISVVEAFPVKEKRARRRRRR